MNTPTINSFDEVMDSLHSARSIKGEPIPRNLIAKCMDLFLQNPRNFIIGSRTSLSRKKSFFNVHKGELKFYNQYGEAFDFNEEAEEVLENEIFMAVSGNNSDETTVYMYFPYDGAVR